MDNGIPSLTLEPPVAPAAVTAPSMPSAIEAPNMPQAVQAVQATAVPAAPTLTLTPEAEQQQQNAQQENVVQLGEDMLTEEEKAIVADFATKIDISDSNMVMTYGAAAQQHIASF